MKKLLSLLFVLGLALSACGTSQTQSVPPAQTSTASLIPSATQTPIPPTVTVTPLPTIPTFTPTFDVSTILTVTPAEMAECPKKTIQKEFKLNNLNNQTNDRNQQFIRYTLDYLNSGGSTESIIKSYPYPDEYLRIQDVTGDGTDELIFAYGIWINIFGCNSGNFQTLSTFTTQGAIGSRILDIVDINLDGLYEIIAYFDGCLGGRCPSIKVYRWSGFEFLNLITSYQECARVSYAPLDVKIEDLDNNGTKEIILHNEGRPWPDGLGFPYRGETHICMWNGNTISLYQAKYSPPYYRFQALQDGDALTMEGKFTKAFHFYQQTIFDKELEWFTAERSVYDFWGYHSKYFPSFADPTSTAAPLLDPGEYPRLAAYAYYRIMLLHLVQGGEAEAASRYQTLQETFGSDPYAAPYVEMASAFWESYQSTQKMYDGCAAAIQYAVEHPEILVPLGSDYHGWQSHIYEPADVCPFR